MSVAVAAAGKGERLFADGGRIHQESGTFETIRREQTERKA